MSTRPRLFGIILFSLALAAAGCAALVHGSMDQVRQAFEADARAAHQQMAQQVAQAEALLATLALLQPAASPGQPGNDTRLTALYPAVQKMLQRDGAQSWPAPWQSLLDEAEAASRTSGQTALTGIDLAAGRCWIVRRGEPASFALQLDLRRVAADAEVLLAGSGGVRAWLEQGGERRMITAVGDEGDFASGWHFSFRQRLAGDRLPIELVAVKRYGWLMLPWAAIVGWCAAVVWVTAILQAWLKTRSPRERPLPRPGGRRRSDLVVTSAQPSPPWAAPRVPAGGTPVPLRSLWATEAEPPELSVAKGAIAQAARDSRHAADVIGRLRHTGHAPGSGTRLQAVRLDEIVRDALELASPECERLGVLATLSTQSDARTVRADIVALEQVTQQLINRALQALAQVPLTERQLDLGVHLQDGHVVFVQRDNGPLPTPEQLERLFAAAASGPAATGIGAESADAVGRGAGDLHGSGALVQAMGGSLSAMPGTPRGTVFRLVLPLSD